MFSEVLDRATQITGGEDGWASLPGYNRDKSQKAFLADEFIRLTKTDDLKWLISFSKHIILTTTEDFTVVLTRHTQTGGRYTGGTISFYCLVVFRNGQEVLSLNDRCDDNDYTSDSRRVLSWTFI